MSTVPGHARLTCRMLGNTELDRVLSLKFPVEQLDRYLGSLEDIVAAVRRGAAHRLIGIEDDGALVGFYAIHPDKRDFSRWWLGWFGIDQSHQGGGRGARVMRDVVARLKRIPSCREIRLLVAPENAGALRLYQRAGFLLHGLSHETAELIMRLVLPGTRPSGQVPARFWANAILLAVIDARSCRMGLPVAAKLHGEVAHPP
ncbi:MAG: GNAT family N-acetyltransferase [Alphaproteobacteria bacterium]|nr:MAG: GNAT family N-acetyltransferase [Alphaproteobacteria bacterium]